MTGFISKPPIEQEEQGELDQNPNPKSFNDPLDFFDPKTQDFSSIDSFLDFDAINWLENHPNPSSTGFGFFERDMEMNSEGSKVESRVGDKIKSGLELISVKSEPFDDGSEPTIIASESFESDASQQISSVSDSFPKTMADNKELKTKDSFTLSIEKEMGRVSLVEGSDSAAKNEPKSDSESESDGDSESESENSSSSSASSDSNSSSDDESEEEEEKEDRKEKKELEEKISMKQVDVIASDCEEGEIKSVDGEENDGKTNEDDDEEEEDDDDDDADIDAMVGWSDVEEDFGASANGPIKSKNELKDLPPVPRVDVTLEPHHNVLPVGVVLSMISTQVIVEGVEKHNPLSEGSILWITETRSPLGIVDEIFGPVKNPYYIVRYNSESEVPAGIQQGTRISFVAEFADYVLNNKDLYKKGYDASGDNDEEISEEFEFSDDEKEAEHRRMQKTGKRGTGEQYPRNMKNNRKKLMNKDGGGMQMNRHSTRKNDNSASQPPRPPQPSYPNQRNVLPPTTPSSGHVNFQASPVTGQNYSGGSGPVPRAFQQMPRPDFFAPNGFPGMQWNNQPHPYSVPMANPMLMQNRMPTQTQNQMPVSNPMLFQPQFGPGQFPFPNMVMPNGQANFFWPPQLAGQSSFNQPAFGGMVFNVPPSSVPQAANADNLRNSANSSEAPPQPFSMGAASSGRGRRQHHHRGGGRFGRGRGPQQSR